MDNITIRITAQYYENYAIGPNGPEGSPYWKPKGSHEFIIEGADSDVVLYSLDLEAILTKMVYKQSNDYVKYVYLDHEKIFTEPTKLSVREFNKELKKQYEETNLKW